MSQILRYDWLPERTRCGYLAISGLHAVSVRKWCSLCHIIGPLHDPITWYLKISYAGMVSKLHSGTSKTKQLVPVHLGLPLFWKSHCATCSLACVILYHVTGSCKEPITYKSFIDQVVLVELVALILLLHIGQLWRQKCPMQFSGRL